MWQARHVAALLHKQGMETELLPIETSGDRKLDVTLSKIGEKGLFTMELEELLLAGKAHLAVHSAKDMPGTLPEGLEIIAFSHRENPADVLVSFNKSLRLQDAGIRIGTSSTRRIAMLKRHAPEAQPITIRGNLQTRFRKMKEGSCDAMLLARAGVIRMGFEEYITEELATSIFTPVPGQASLAIEVAETLDPVLKSAIRSAVNDLSSELAISAERSFLRQMEGGCSIPVFALCMPDDAGNFQLDAGIVSLDGSKEIRRCITIPRIDSGKPDAFRIAGEALASEVLKAGGSAILSAIRCS